MTNHTSLASYFPSCSTCRYSVLSLACHRSTVVIYSYPTVSYKLVN